MVYEITGKIDDICGIQTFKSGFQKRDIFVDVQDEKSRYPNIVKFTATKDWCSSLDSFRRGDEVKIRFVLSGHVWESPKGRQVFNDLKILKIEVAGSRQKSYAPSHAEQSDKASEVYSDECEMPF